MEELDKPATRRALNETETVFRDELMQTERVIRGEIGILRSEFKESENSLRVEITETKNLLRNEIAETKSELREEISASELRLRTEMQEQTKGIIEHFNFVAEQIRADVSGANKDEISSLQNKIDDHESRIQSLETH